MTECDEVGDSIADATDLSIIHTRGNARAIAIASLPTETQTLIDNVADRIWRRAVHYRFKHIA